MSFSRGSPQPRDSTVSPAWQADSLPAEPEVRLVLLISLQKESLLLPFLKGNFNIICTTLYGECSVPRVYHESPCTPSLLYLVYCLGRCVIAWGTFLLLLQLWLLFVVLYNILLGLH